MAKEKSIQETKTFNDLLVAHQIMPTLTAIRWSLKMLFDGDFGKISKDQKNIIEKIIKKDEVLISLVGRLLNADRIEKGRPNGLPFLF